MWAARSNHAARIKPNVVMKNIRDNTSWNESALVVLVAVFVFANWPATLYAQNSASVSLDVSGNLVLSAVLEFDEGEAQAEFDGNPWNEFDPITPYSFLYYDLRNTNYDNGYVGSPANLESIFITNPLDPALKNNKRFITDLFYMGAYHFGDSYYGSNTLDIPNFETSGNNTYFAGKANAGGVVDSLNNQLLSYRITLPFDESYPAVYNQSSFIFKDASGDTVTTGHSTHHKEAGIDATLKGDWISGNPTCGNNITDCGLITGDYEFVMFVEFHDEDALGTQINLISAYQDDLPYIRFTLIDEDTSTTPSVTITESTTYIGEAGISTGSAFVIDSGASVEFIVGNGNGIIFNAGFKANLGSSFITTLGGGTPVAKGGSFAFPGNDIVDYVPEAKPFVEKSLTVFPNPSAQLPAFHLGKALYGNVALSLYDIQGRVIGTQTVFVIDSAVSKMSLNELFGGVELSSGVYILRASTDDITESVLFTILP